VVTFTLCCLELVNQTQGNHVVGVDAGSVGEIVVVHQVDFVINIGGHVFVEEVGRTQVDEFDQILIAVVLAVTGAAQVFTFGLVIADERTQTEVELVVRIGFEALRLVGVAVTAAYSKSDRTETQQTGIGDGKSAEAWSTAVKYDANNVYLAAMYGETRNSTAIISSDDNYLGAVNKEQKFEAVAQYQFDFGLRPSLAYVQSKGKDIETIGDQDLYKYISVGSYYYFNKNMSTYVDYKINLLDENDYTRATGTSTDNTVGVGLVYQF